MAEDGVMTEAPDSALLRNDAGSPVSGPMYGNPRDGLSPPGANPAFAESVAPERPLTAKSGAWSRQKMDAIEAAR